MFPKIQPTPTHLWLTGTNIWWFADVLAKSRHFDLLVIIPASLQRDRSKLQTVRETWAKDIDSKTHLCQRHGDFWSVCSEKLQLWCQHLPSSPCPEKQVQQRAHREVSFHVGRGGSRGGCPGMWKGIDIHVDKERSYWQKDFLLFPSLDRIVLESVRIWDRYWSCWIFFTVPLVAKWRRVSQLGCFGSGTNHETSMRTGKSSGRWRCGATKAWILDVHHLRSIN